MLDELAWEYVSLPELALRAIAYGCLIVGAVIAGAVNRSKSEMQRAPYFALSMLLVLAATAVQVIWLLSVQALEGGFLWVLVSVEILFSVAMGFFYCRLAMARARDAFGHGDGAILAFIPFLNLILLFKRSRQEISPNRRPIPDFLTGIAGVVVGFLLVFAAAVLSTVVEKEITRRLESQAADAPQLITLGVKLMIQDEGLAATLQMMAAEAELPIVVDDVTAIVRIEAEGDELRRYYAVDLTNVAMTDDFRREIEGMICGYVPFKPLLEAGATIREVFTDADGIGIGEQAVTLETCGF